MLKRIAFIICFGFVLYSWDANAGSINYTFEYSPGNQANNFLRHHWAFRDKLYGYLSYKAEPNTGEMWVNLVITNGHKWRGFTVCTGVVFQNKDASRSINLGWRHGVNPRKNRVERREYKIDPSVLSEFRTVSVYWDRCPSKRLWKDLVLKGLAAGAASVIGPQK